MKRKSTRVIFGYKNKNYKFVSFFPDKKDGSFYFHQYKKPSETKMEPKIPLHKRNDNKIDFSNYYDTGFDDHKTSFHQSGYIHTTDKYGNRFKNGIIGVPFDNVKTHLFFLVLAPKHPEKLVEVSKIDSTRDIYINLSDNIEPFVLHFGIYKKGTTFKPVIKGLLGNIVQIEYSDKPFGLLMAMTKVFKMTPETKVNWPPFTLKFFRYEKIKN